MSAGPNPQGEPPTTDDYHWLSDCEDYRKCPYHRTGREWARKSEFKDKAGRDIAAFLSKPEHTSYEEKMTYAEQAVESHRPPGRYYSIDAVCDHTVLHAACWRLTKLTAEIAELRVENRLLRSLVGGVGDAPTFE